MKTQGKLLDINLNIRFFESDIQNINHKSKNKPVQLHPIEELLYTKGNSQQNTDKLKNLKNICKPSIQNK